MSIISTKRTIIRRPQPTDIEGIIALGSNSIIQSFNCFSTPTREKVEEYLHNTDKHPNRYVIALAQSNSYIGEINFETDSLRYGVNATMLSYNLLPAYQGQGYMKEVMTAVLHYLFIDQKVDLVSARVFATNLISQQLLRKFGFLQEGYLRHAVRCNPQVVNDDCLFSLLKEEYFGQVK